MGGSWARAPRAPIWAISPVLCRCGKRSPKSAGSNPNRASQEPTIDPRGGKNRFLEPSWGLFGARSAPSARQGRSGTASGQLLGRSWRLLGPSWGALGVSWGPLGPPGMDPGSSLEAPGGAPGGHFVQYHEGGLREGQKTSILKLCSRFLFFYCWCHFLVCCLPCGAPGGHANIEKS